MTVSLFCDECGASLPAYASSCAFCGYPLATTPHPPVSPASGPLPSGSLLAQRYRILSQIGQGGFATVYKARDRSQRNRLVALKQINVGALSLQEIIDVTDTYNREVTHLSRLRHRNLPRIYDHFTDADHWYVVMEYIEGKTLEEILKEARHGFFPVKRVLDIGIALCQVLGYLHMQRPPIIFRDVKPSNIMITRSGRLCLIDFGIARHYRPGQGKDTSPLGSPGYAAPEQYGRRSQTTPQTDMYGLAATLQTLLTGKEPLELLTTSSPSGGTVPRTLQPLLTRMLERDAHQRPRNMDEVERELQHLKEQSFGQKMKRLLAVIWQILKSFFRHIPMIALMLFSLFPLLALNGFFNSALWTLYLFIVPCIILGRMALDLYREMASRRRMEEVAATMNKRFWRSLLYAWIGVWIMGVLYYCLSFQQEDHSVLELVVLVSAVSCLILLIYWARRGLRWLRHTGTAQPHRSIQPVPLQQQVIPSRVPDAHA